MRPLLHQGLDHDKPPLSHGLAQRLVKINRRQEQAKQVIPRFLDGHPYGTL